MSDRDSAVGRFAPSPTGPAHPGTLLSGLLAWLDARSSGARFVLRLEDIDPQRAKAQWSRAMLADLAWLGLDWDEEVVQSQRRPEHEGVLDQLARDGVLYGCTCTRAVLRRTATPAADGSRLYPGTCRHRRLGAADWRAFEGAVRLRLPERPVAVRLLRGGSHTFHPAQEMGDPIVRRKDGAMAYNLAVVVDDVAAGVTRVVRGADLFYSTGVHALVYALLGAEAPAYWHHPLLMEPRGNQKLAKLHGSVSAALIREHMDAEQVCGFLAACVGLGDGGSVSPQALLAGFSVRAVAEQPVVVTWDGAALRRG